MIKFLAVLLCACAAYAQIPQPCFSPPLLTFRTHEYNQALTTFRYFHAEYDNQGERFAFYEVEESSSTPGRQYFQIIILHKEHVIYEYNRNTHTCHKAEAGPFHPFGVPSNARYEGEYYIGGPMDDLEAVEWSDRSDVRREEWLGVFSRINCYPIRTWAHNGQTNQTIHNHIFDLVVGIQDPTLFDPPHECQNATYAEPSSTTRGLMSMYLGKLL